LGYLLQWWVSFQILAGRMLTGLSSPPSQEIVWRQGLPFPYPYNTNTLLRRSYDTSESEFAIVERAHVLVPSSGVTVSNDSLVDSANQPPLWKSAVVAAPNGAAGPVKLRLRVSFTGENGADYMLDES
jgi:hypothetical protein